MKRTEPLNVIWWLVSRASGIVALVLISATVLLGLAMAARTLRRPAIKRVTARLHEHLALAAIGAIALHGAALLGDHWLKPGWRGITIPFALNYRPEFTGVGIIAGYLAAVLGPSFYLRRRIGTRRWRSLRRLTVLVWALSAAHTLGAGSTDAPSLWLRAIALAPPVAYLLVLRLAQPRPSTVAGRGADERRPATGKRRAADLACAAGRGDDQQRAFP